MDLSALLAPPSAGGAGAGDRGSGCNQKSSSSTEHLSLSSSSTTITAATSSSSSSSSSTHLGTSRESTLSSCSSLSDPESVVSLTGQEDPEQVYELDDDDDDDNEDNRNDQEGRDALVQQKAYINANGMTERRRKGSTAAEPPELHQLWQGVRAKLGSIQAAQNKVNEATDVVNALHAQMDELEQELSEAQLQQEDMFDEEEAHQRKLEMRDRLLAALDVLNEHNEEEKRLAAEAAEQVGIVMALTNPEQQQLQVPNDTNKRKKRRLDTSPAPSDVSSRASPAPQSGSNGTPGPEKDKDRQAPPVSRSLSRSLSVNTSGRAASPNAEATPSTASSSHPPSSARGTGKGAVYTSRKGSKDAGSSQQQPHSATTPSTASSTSYWYNPSQQPELAEGRPVAVKPPEKGKASRTKEGGETAYIQARVVKCINKDKGRYEVQDVEDEHDEAKPGASFKVNWQSIVPMPDSRDRSTYPATPYPVGSKVMSLYPNTTSFYIATVAAVPATTKRPTYKLVFSDDDDELRPISADHVVAVPPDAM